VCVCVFQRLFMSEGGKSTGTSQQVECCFTCVKFSGRESVTWQTDFYGFLRICDVNCRSSSSCFQLITLRLVYCL